MAQHLWKAVGWCKPTVRPLLSISRVFSSSHPINGTPLDPVQRRIRNDKRNEYYRLKRRTDPDWALKRQARELKATTKTQAAWSEERYQQQLEYYREYHRTQLAKDPQYRSKIWLKEILRKHSWARERLPWKSYTPVLYEDKVQHTCHTCLIPKRGGAFKLWFANHDGKHYQCPTCYLRGSDIMPQGYEDVSSMVELKKRMHELGH
jgi:hypothetical protein